MYHKLGFRWLALSGFAAALHPSFAQAVSHKRPAKKPAAAVHMIPASGLLSVDDLKAIPSYADKLATDQFTPPPISAFIGRRFEVEIPVASSYNLGDQTLTLDPGSFSDLVIGGSDTVKSGSFIGQNEYGATARVNVFETHQFALRQATRGSTTPESINLVTSYQLPPDKARAISGKLVVEGTVQADKILGVAFCGLDDRAATLDNTNEDKNYTCYTDVEYDHISLVDQATGKVLSEWTRKPFSRLAHVKDTYSYLYQYDDVDIRQPEDKRLPRITTVQVVIRCNVDKLASANCHVESESPTGTGFAEYALNRVKLMSFEPGLDDNGNAIDSFVDVPVNWQDH